MKIIRDQNQKIIGRDDGKVMRDDKGKIVARYDKTTDTTRDANSKRVGTGDQRQRLL